MNYIVFKTTGRKEYRIYLESDDFEGSVIYKGHKLGVELDLLTQLIDFRVEKSSNRVYILRYDKVISGVSILDTAIWKIGTTDSFNKLILESWESLQRAMESRFGKFRKILITAVNI